MVYRMALTPEQKNDIKELLLDKTRTKLKNYNPETNATPFHHKLLGKDRMALFSFIHSINTMLGQSIFEQIGVIISKSNITHAKGAHKLTGHISIDVVRTIDRIMRTLRDASRVPNKAQETDEILAVANTGEMGKELKKNVDLYIENDDKIICYEIKTAKPNIDVFERSKIKLLEWIALHGTSGITKDIHTRIAIPYNPYEPKSYNRWTLQGLFDLDEELRVGQAFWDELGGAGTYFELLDIFTDAGNVLESEIDDRMQEIGGRSS